MGHSCVEVTGVRIRFGCFEVTEVRLLGSGSDAEVTGFRLPGSGSAAWRSLRSGC